MKTILQTCLINLLGFCMIVPSGFFFKRTLSTVKVIHIQPLGKVRKTHLQKIGSSIESFYGIPCVIKPPVGIKEGLLFDDQGTYDAHRILSKYDADERVVFVTDKKISKKFLRDGFGLNGMAILWGEKMVVSTFHMRKLHGNSGSFRADLTKTALHEVGHTFGLDHCKVPRCVMYTSDTYHPPVETSKLTLCNKCRKEIGMVKPPRVR